MTYLEAQQNLARKLDIDIDDISNNGLFTAADLQEWIWQGILRAWNYKKWDFSEGSKTLTLTGDQITDGYIDYPTNLKAGSIYFIRIGGYEYKKRTFIDYLKYLEENPTGERKIWAERKRFLFFNTNVAAAGNVLDAFGKLKPTKPSADGDLLPFSPDSDNYENSGNHAIVLLAYAEALDSEKKRNPNQATAEEAKALRMLSEIWAEEKDDRATEQPNRPMLNVPDMFSRNGNAATDADHVGRFNYLGDT